MIIAARLPLETIFLVVGLEIKKCTKEKLVGPGIQLRGWCDGGGGGGRGAERTAVNLTLNSGAQSENGF